jgi:hypothetical protein
MIVGLKSRCVWPCLDHEDGALSSRHWTTNLLVPSAHSHPRYKYQNKSQHLD